MQVSVTTRRVLPASGVYKPRKLLTNLPCTGQLPAKDYHATSVSGAAAETLAL